MATTIETGTRANTTSASGWTMLGAKVLMAKPRVRHKATKPAATHLTWSRSTG
jgi:hypothetical protein